MLRNGNTAAGNPLIIPAREKNEFLPVNRPSSHRVRQTHATPTNTEWPAITAAWVCEYVTHTDMCREYTAVTINAWAF